MYGSRYYIAVGYQSNGGESRGGNLTCWSCKNACRTFLSHFGGVKELYSIMISEKFGVTSTTEPLPKKTTGKRAFGGRVTWLCSKKGWTFHVNVVCLGIFQLMWWQVALWWRSKSDGISARVRPCNWATTEFLQKPQPISKVPPQRHVYIFASLVFGRHESRREKSGNAFALSWHFFRILRRAFSCEQGSRTTCPSRSQFSKRVWHPYVKTWTTNTFRRFVFFLANFPPHKKQPKNKTTTENKEPSRLLAYIPTVTS